MSHNTNKNVPAVRFAGFEGVWRKGLLRDVTEINPRTEVPDFFEYVDLESVSGTSLVSHRSETRETAPSRACRKAEFGDIFYQMVRPYQRNNFLFNMRRNDYVFSSGYAQLRPSVNSLFLMGLVQTDVFVSAVMQNCAGTSYPAVTPSALSTIPLSYPSSTKEQSRIGQFFRALDKLIELRQKKLERLILLKKQLLNKLFPRQGQKVPDIRFAGFEEEWEQLPLVKVVSTPINGEWGADDPFGNGTKVLRTTNFTNGGHIDYADVVTRCIAQNKVEGKSLQNGDILIEKSGGTDTRPVGRVVIYLNASGSFLFNNFTALLRPKRELVNNYFLFLFLYITHLNGGTILYENRTTGIHNLQLTDYLKGTPIRFPELKEQSRIGQFFQVLDKLIELWQKELEKQKALKQTLLRGMFV